MDDGDKENSKELIAKILVSIESTIIQKMTV
jgi:hypothetical protein